MGYYILTVILSSFIAIEGRNDDVFSYGNENTIDYGPNGSGVRSFGQPNWGDVTCSDRNTCLGYPDKFPYVRGFEVGGDSNCKWCPDDGSENCGIHRQSPINLKRDPGVTGGPEEKDCPDWHWLLYKDDSCSWDDMKSQFKIARHELQIDIPQLPNGDIDCVEDGIRRYPRLDYSKGFPDWWHMQRTAVQVPSQHHQEGIQYAAEVTLQHFYEIEHYKNKLGHVSFFLQDYPDAESWNYLDKLICAWRLEEENVRAKCGLPPAQPYGRCKLFRDQEPTEEWLIEAGLKTSSPLSPPIMVSPTIPLPTMVSPTTPPPIVVSPTTPPPIMVSPTTPPPIMVSPTTPSPIMVSPVVVVQTTPSPSDVDYLGAGNPDPALGPVSIAAIPTSTPISATISSPVTLTSTPTAPTAPTILVPPMYNCNDRKFNYKNMCHSSDPCCESTRSDTDFCWDAYDGLGDDIESACYHCCDTPKLVGPPNPSKSGLPKTIQCSAVENPNRICKTDSCCQNPRSTSEYCRETYDKYSSNEMEQICHYCCSDPQDLGPARRHLTDTIDKPVAPAPSPWASVLDTDFFQAFPAFVPISTDQETRALPLNPPSTTPTIDVLTPTIGPTTLEEFFDAFLNAPSESDQSSDAPADMASDVPSYLPTNLPSDVPSDVPYSLPSDVPSSVPSDSPSDVPSGRSASKDLRDIFIPRSIDCKDGRADYDRMCNSMEPCCESKRSDTSFCWDSYDKLGDDVESACYHCCDKPKFVGPPAPEKDGVPKSVQCSNIDNPHRICKEGSCCSNPRSKSEFCLEQYEKHGDMMEEICHYCCIEPMELGPKKRALRSPTDIEHDNTYVPPGAVVTHVKGKRFLLRKENFEVEEYEKDEDAYFESMHSAFKKRSLQGSTTIHLEDYTDVDYWPYEWFLKVQTEYYFRYEGTELVPPCWEVVHWRPMKDPIRVHKRQIDELHRLLAWRRNPDTCAIDTAGIVSDDGNRVKANREVQYQHKQHRVVFCECKDWPSKFQNDRDWCDNWHDDVNYDRFYKEPYSFESNGEWLP